jgi:hypothetical protein
MEVPDRGSPDTMVMKFLSIAVQPHENVPELVRRPVSVVVAQWCTPFPIKKQPRLTAFRPVGKWLGIVDSSADS